MRGYKRDDDTELKGLFSLFFVVFVSYGEEKHKTSLLSARTNWNVGLCGDEVQKEFSNSLRVNQYNETSQLSSQRRQTKNRSTASPTKATKKRSRLLKKM